MDNRDEKKLSELGGREAPEVPDLTVGQATAILLGCYTLAVAAFAVAAFLISLAWSAGAG